VIGPKEIIARIDARLARHGKLGAALVKGVAGTAGLRAAHAGLGFITAIVLAKILGPSGYGTYSFVMALVAFLAIPAEFGFPRLAIREVAVTNARKEWGYMRGFIIRMHQTIGILTLVLVLAGFLLLSTWGQHLDPVKLQCLWLGLILVPLIALGALRGGMLRGLRKVILGQMPEQVVRPLMLLVLLTVLLLLGANVRSPVGVMGAQIGAATTSFLFGLIMFLRNRPVELSSMPPQFRTTQWLMSSIPFGLTALLQLINGRTDILMLGIFREDAEVGIYRVAAQFGVLVIFGLQAVNAIQGPHIAHLYAVGEMKKLQRMITRSSQAIVAVALPMVLVFILFGKFIIRHTFGETYEASYLPMVILCIGQLVNAAIGSVAWVLNMTGNERDTTRSIFIGATVNVVLNALLTPRWGAIGAAVATASTLIVWNLIMWRLVRLRTGIETSPFSRMWIRQQR
jgi:O-antigen/teichoic acid export membrane protein